MGYPGHIWTHGLVFSDRESEIKRVYAGGPDAEAEMVRGVESRMLQEALDSMPVNFREILILRELEGLSYKEIAEVVNVPMGTVMSSLARGRERLREILLRAREKEGLRGH